MDPSESVASITCEFSLLPRYRCHKTFLQRLRVLRLPQKRLSLLVACAKPLAGVTPTYSAATKMMLCLKLPPKKLPVYILF